MLGSQVSCSLHHDSSAPWEVGAAAMRCCCHKALLDEPGGGRLGTGTTGRCQECRPALGWPSLHSRQPPSLALMPHEVRPHLTAGDIPASASTGTVRFCLGAATTGLVSSSPCLLPRGLSCGLQCPSPGPWLLCSVSPGSALPMCCVLCAPRRPIEWGTLQSQLQGSGHLKVQTWALHSGLSDPWSLHDSVLFLSLPVLFLVPVLTPKGSCVR